MFCLSRLLLWPAPMRRNGAGRPCSREETARARDFGKGVGAQHLPDMTSETFFAAVTSPCIRWRKRRPSEASDQSGISFKSPPIEGQHDPRDRNHREAIGGDVSHAASAIAASNAAQLIGPISPSPCKPCVT